MFDISVFERRDYSNTISRSELKHKAKQYNVPLKIVAKQIRSSELTEYVWFDGSFWLGDDWYNDSMAQVTEVFLKENWNTVAEYINVPLGEKRALKHDNLGLSFYMESNNRTWDFNALRVGHDLRDGFYTLLNVNRKWKQNVNQMRELCKRGNLGEI